MKKQLQKYLIPSQDGRPSEIIEAENAKEATEKYNKKYNNK